MNMIPGMLEYLAQSDNRELTPEEKALLMSSQGQQAPLQMAAQGGGIEGLRQMFRGQGTPVAQPQGQGLMPEDMLPQAPTQQPPMMLAAAPDPYGGVSARTRAAIDRLGRDVGGDMSDLVVGAGQRPPAGTVPGGTPAQQSVRGAQTPKQQQQLIDLLKKRGMSDQEARQRAREVI